MLKFIMEFLIFFAIFAVSIWPVKRASTYVQRRFNQKKWLRAAGIAAFATAGLGWSSRNLQQDCLSERNNGCVDAGGAGTQAVLVIGFVLFSLISAYMIYRD